MALGACGDAGWANVALLGDQIGALVSRRKADFLLLDYIGTETRPHWDFTWEIVRFFDRADILASLVDGEPVQIGGRSTRMGSARFFDAAELEAAAAVRAAGLVQLHGRADDMWPR
jgi:cytosine/adenosine deaminase-related metal-dependent hydrolase